MKRLTLALLIIFTAMTACKKDDAERSNERLIGRWTVESMAYVEYVNGQEKERDQYSNPGLEWEFRKDGTAVVNTDGEDVDAKWTVTDKNLQLVVPDGTKLDLTIISLTNNNLHLSIENDVEIRNGITYKEIVELKLHK